MAPVQTAPAEEKRRRRNESSILCLMSLSFNCRSCGSGQGALILDLGLQPLANNLLRQEDLSKAEPKFPLRLAVCQSCWLLQILDLVPPVQLFSEYLYFSSFSDLMLRHARQAAERYIKQFALDQQSLVVEIASNDGYSLQNFQNHGVPCLGIEPAANIAKVAREKGIETLVGFFGNDLAKELVGAGPAPIVPLSSPSPPAEERAGERRPFPIHRGTGSWGGGPGQENVGARPAENVESSQADLILGNNVFAHAPNTNDFVAGLRTLLKPRGRIILEFPYAVDLIEKGEFDTIYHEHVFYFSLTALRPLFERQGLSIYHVERLPIHGGSLRLFASLHGAHLMQPSVGLLLEEETRKGLASLSYYEGFAQRVVQLKHSLVSLLQQLKQQGKSVAGYGASAKGSTLLNFFGLGKGALEFVADRSIYKQSRLTPGAHIPIVPPSRLLEKMPDYTLLLTWNFADEILEQQKAYREKGGKFIIPIPSVRIL